MKIRPVGAELFHADRRTAGRTGMTKLIVAFRNSANALRNVNCASQYFRPPKNALKHVFNLLKPTGHVMQQQVQHSTTVRSAHTVFMCFVFIWEQTATCATYSIN